LNGQSYAACYPDLRKENFCSFLRQVRERNPRHHILIILDNSRVHTCIEASMTAWELNISFLHLPYYSPHLNPIEKIWKQIKRIFTPRLLRTKTEMTNIITNEFNIQTKTNSHAKKWIRTILEDKYKKLHNYDQLYKYKN
jgi:transposase